MWMPETTILYFCNLATPPDKGISQALDLLGFRFAERWSQEAMRPPFEILRTDLAQSPAILGPLDMGFLYYNPLHANFSGADHFVLAYAIDDHEIYLHDPLGFPHVSLSLEHLECAWKAENIDYRRGSYRYWTALQRYAQPAEKELYSRAIQAFQASYQASDRIATHEPWAKDWAIGRDAILRCVKQIRQGNVAPHLKAHLINFMLKLGARRALDFAEFFVERSPALATLKSKQAELLGKSHTLAVRENWGLLADTLQTLADIEEKFRIALLNH
jgi:hypothetical protein